MWMWMYERTHWNARKNVQPKKKAECAGAPFEIKKRTYN